MRIKLLHRYILKEFLITLGLCLFAAVSLFLVVDFFEQIRILVKQDSDIRDTFLYMLYKIPLILHLMTPVAVLIAVLISIGRLSQLSEITAMRACGASLLLLAKPLLLSGTIISGLVFISGETLVPWATQRVDEIFHLDIKKKRVKGGLSRSNYWYRAGDTFYSIGLYDSREAALSGLSIFDFSKDFNLRRRIDAMGAKWNPNPQIGWTMDDAIQISVDSEGKFEASAFRKLPLVIEETPEDFDKMKRRSESLSYSALGEHIDKLKAEGVPVIEYSVERAAKLSFPLVNLIGVLIAFPFALIPARSGSLTKSFVAGVSIGFGYYLIHAISSSLASAELLPVLPAVWTANVVMGTIGAYLMSGAETR